MSALFTDNLYGFFLFDWCECHYLFLSLNNTCFLVFLSSFSHLLVFCSTVVCFDAKINFDDNAEFRQKAIFAMDDMTESDPTETEAAKYDLKYIGLDGNIACFGRFSLPTATILFLFFSLLSTFLCLLLFLSPFFLSHSFYLSILSSFCIFSITLTQFLSFVLTCTRTHTPLGFQTFVFPRHP